MLIRRLTSLALTLITLLLGCSEADSGLPPGSESQTDAASATTHTSTSGTDAGASSAGQDAASTADAATSNAAHGSDAAQDADVKGSIESGAARAEAGTIVSVTTDAGQRVDAAADSALPPVRSTAMDGPFPSTQDLSSGPKSKSGLFRPSELGQGGLKHPVFVWGCGGGSTPTQYADQLKRIATHGFIVIAEVSQIGDDGAPLRAAIDWISTENARAQSPFYQKVETTKIALGGHSIGSANAFLVADDPRLTTTIHVAGGSLDDVGDPFSPTTGTGGKRLVHPVAYICSMSDSFGNVEKTQKDFDNTRVPAWMTVMTGVDHVAAARTGLPATLAWLRWHLAGESERRSAFLEPGGEFTTGIFVSRDKNW